MLRSKIGLIILFFFAGCFNLLSQVLTLDEAINIALKNNYDILIAANDTLAAGINNSAGNAGMLPKINITSTDNNTINNLDQKYSTGTEVKKSNVNANSITASAGFTWTLFDGMKMFITKEKLATLEAQSLISFKDNVQNILSSVISAYFNIVSQKQEILAQIETNKISEERVKIAKVKFENGSGGKTDLLQAQIDLNEGKSVLLQLNVDLEQKKNLLNQIIARAIEQPFEVIDSIPVNFKISQNDILSKINDKNLSVLLYASNLQVSKLSLKEIQSQRMPQLNFLLGYNYSYSKSGAGLMLFNQGIGPNYGFNISFPVFNGFNINRQIKVASLDVIKSQYELDKIKLQVNNDLLKAFKNYSYSLEVLKIEEDNIELAKENAKICLERLKLSQATSIEMITAQNSLAAAYNRLITARYNAKLSETELMRLNGELIK
ncbi:MAG: TolC family protein [Bacteroidales bacterium]|jgi:outer membrane protein TolC